MSPNQGHYETVPGPRFRLQSTGAGHEIRIKAQRHWFVLLFLMVWLGAWTVGGYSVITSMLPKAGESAWFVWFWLAMWLLGWLSAATSIAWMLAGAEVLRCANHDLEVSRGVFGLARRKRYRGQDITQLTATELGAASGWSDYRVMPAFTVGGQGSGCVKFTYGARDVFVGAGLDAAEGRLIVAELRRHLPASAFATPTSK